MAFVHAWKQQKAVKSLLHAELKAENNWLSATSNFLMINKTQRISTFRASWLLKKGAKFSNEFFSVKFLLNKKDFNRYSVVVSKKIFKLATDRNSLRRQLYEALRTLTPGQNPGFDLMITVKPKIDQLTFSEKETQLKILLGQVASKLSQIPSNG